jgi:hypothetical protein
VVRLINEKGGSMQLNHTMREGLWDPWAYETVQWNYALRETSISYQSFTSWKPGWWNSPLRLALWPLRGAAVHSVLLPAIWFSPLLLRWVQLLDLPRFGSVWGSVLSLPFLFFLCHCALFEWVRIVLDISGLIAGCRLLLWIWIYCPPLFLFLVACR